MYTDFLFKIIGAIGLVLISYGILQQHQYRDKLFIVGGVCLEIYSKKMAEIRSLAVDPKHLGAGIGAALVAKCIENAKKKKILEVMAISSQEKFFQKLGFDYTLPGERKALFVNP